MNHPEQDIEFYGDPRIASKDAKIPSWLVVIYVIVFCCGLIGMVLYWNGANGWIDRGYWYQLEQAANTTFPWHNAIDPSENK